MAQPNYERSLCVSFRLSVFAHVLYIIVRCGHVQTLPSRLDYNTIALQRDTIGRLSPIVYLL